MESNISNRTIGVELECVVPIIGTGQNDDVQRLLAEVLTNHGIKSVARGYSHDSIRNGIKLAIEYDNSLQGESRYRGLSWSKIEVKTAPMTWTEMEQVLPPALDIIRYCGARVNGTTGFHVHHHLPEAESQSEVVRSLQNLWWRFHKVIFGVVAPSRKSNTYCCPPTLTDVKAINECHSHARLMHVLRGTSRFVGLNLLNLTNPGRMTVEWRLHHGTLEWEKVKTWVLATQRWVEHAVSRNCHFKPEPIANTQAGLNSLLVTTGLKPNSRIYRKVNRELRQVGKFLLRRWKHFNIPLNFKNRESEAA